MLKFKNAANRDFLAHRKIFLDRREVVHRERLDMLIERARRIERLEGEWAEFDYENAKSDVEIAKIDYEMAAHSARVHNHMLALHARTAGEKVANDEPDSASAKPRYRVKSISRPMMEVV